MRILRQAIPAIVVADLVMSTFFVAGELALCGFGFAIVLLFYFVAFVLFIPFWPLLTFLPGASPTGPGHGWPISALFATLALAFFLLQRSPLSRRQLVAISFGLLLLAALAGYGSYKWLMPFRPCK